jgi:hypothetical protein
MTSDHIPELTPEQVSMIPEWENMWMKHALCTEPADRDTFTKAALELYQILELGTPEIIWVESPMEGARKVAELCREPHETMKQAMIRTSSGYIGGQFWSWWCAYTSFFQQVCGVELSERDKKLAECEQAMAKSAGWWWPLDKAVVVVERPSEIHVDENGNLHCVDGPAIEWRDGFALYAILGISVPKEYVTEPLDAKTISKERNAEIRRVLISKFGEDRYLEEMGAKVIHQDVDLLGNGRRLLRFRAKGAEVDEVWVEVTNSTPEPDGRRKKYFLRCHPELRPLIPGSGGELGDPQELTCHNAVASTFGLRGEEYFPLVET